MQIVIDIPDEKYDRLLYQDIISLRSYVENGIVLPKGHGRLVDADEIDNNIYDLTRSMDLNYGQISEVVDNAPTIIEADKKCKAKVITRGNCMMCGKELDEGLFFCKECEAKAESEDKE